MAAWRNTGRAPHRQPVGRLQGNLSKDDFDDLTVRYRSLCSDHGMTPTRNNRDAAHENGAIGEYSSGSDTHHAGRLSWPCGAPGRYRNEHAALHPVRTVCAAIMAWGGMCGNHRRSLFANDGRDWLHAAEDIRSGRLDRKAAYGRLQDLRNCNKLTGAGPAYFTKLIYFLMPCGSHGGRHGCIMDQWSGCSVNLLLGHELVRMNISRTWKRSKRASRHRPSFEFRVADGNTPDIYEQFCRAVDRQADRFGLDVKQVDRALVSAGEPNPECWRRYGRHRRFDGIRGAFGAPGP